MRSVIIDQAIGIRKQTQSGDMPPDNRSLTQAEKELISVWVDQGAMDN